MIFRTIKRSIYIYLGSLLCATLMGCEKAEGPKTLAISLDSKIENKCSEYVLKETKYGPKDKLWSEWSQEEAFRKLGEEKPTENAKRKKLDLNVINNRRVLDELYNNLKNQSNASFSVRINNKLPEFKFKIVGIFKDNDFYPSYVDISDCSSGKFIQKLKAKNRFDNSFDGQAMGWDCFDFQFVDLNFDGYLDLRILYNLSGNGNATYASYLFDPISEKFIYNKVLSKMFILHMDSESKEIITHFRSGACFADMKYYKVENNNFIVTKVIWTELQSPNLPCLRLTAIPLREGMVTGDELPPHNYDYVRQKNKILKKWKILKQEWVNISLDGGYLFDNSDAPEEYMEKLRGKIERKIGPVSGDIFFILDKPLKMSVLNRHP